MCNAHSTNSLLFFSFFFLSLHQMLLPHLHLHPTLWQMYDCVASMKSQIESGRELNLLTTVVYTEYFLPTSDQPRCSSTLNLPWHFHLHSLQSFSRPLLPSVTAEDFIIYFKKVGNIIIASRPWHYSIPTFSFTDSTLPWWENTSAFNTLHNHLSP